MSERFPARIGTHYESCWKDHPECAYHVGVADATARIIRIIESMDDPRSIRSMDCSDVFTPAAFEDWCDDLIAAIQEDGDE